MKDRDKTHIGAPLTDAEEAECLLAADLHRTDVWIRALIDTGVQAAGFASFSGKIETLALPEAVDLQLSASAVYYSFIYKAHPGQNSFRNRILYGTEAFESAERLLAARCHEFIHALQYDTAAALHADPFNEASGIIVSPRDYILRKERLEQDAYAKGAWLCALAADALPHLTRAMAGSPLPIGVFQDILARAGTLDAALPDAARAARNLEGFWHKDGGKTRIADEWHARALEEYAHIVGTRRKNGETLTFVRLEDADYREIGESFGPNTFGAAQDGTLCRFESLSPANAEKLAALEAACGITDHAALPTFGETLRAHGLSRADFLAQSKKHTGKMTEAAPSWRQSSGAAIPPAP